MIKSAKSQVNEKVISRSTEVMSGTAVFAGTRVPVQTLMDYLAGNHSLEEFLEDFPTVSREQAVELLHRLKGLLQDANL